MNWLDRLRGKTSATKQERIAAHIRASHADERAQYRGQWIAIQDDKIVQNAPSLQDLKKKVAAANLPKTVHFEFVDKVMISSVSK